MVTPLMKRFLPFACCLAAVTVASLMPGSTMPENVHLPVGADKGIHILMYLALAWSALAALLQPRHRHAPLRILLVLTGIAAYGLLLETIQPLTGSRSFEWADALANTTGTLGGYLLRNRKH